MVLDEDHDSDASENEDQYLQLAKAVSDLDNTRRVRAPTRKEVSTVVSEYHLPKKTSQSGDLISVKELANVLTDKPAHTKIGSKVKRVIKESGTLPKPLEKPVAEKIKRIVGYVNVKGQLQKWNPVVQNNRAAEHLSFPVQGGRITLQNSDQFLNKFKTQTPLEVEMYKILGGKDEENKTEKETEEYKSLEFPLTLEEMLEKKKELAQIRAKLSYQEAKAHRQSKIKSKKYHRIVKREKIKKQIKEFEELVKTDPEAALKKLEALDKSRAQERASLRHKNTGKWARNLAVRAKYDKDSRKVLAEQLKLSRDLTEKVKNSINSDEDVSDQEKDTETVNEKMFVTSQDNPWALNVSSEVSDFVSSCKDYWKNQNKNTAPSSKTNDSPGGNKTNAHASSDSLVKDNNAVNDVLENTKEKPAKKNDSPGGDKTHARTPSDGLVKDSTVVNAVRENVKEKPAVNGIDSMSRSDNKKLKRKSDATNTGVSKSKPAEAIVAKNCKGSKSTSPPENNVSPTVNKVKNDKKSKTKSGEKLAKSEKDVQSTLGSWTVTELDENKKRKAVADIDDIFDDLDDKIASQTSKKLKKVQQKYLNKKSKSKSKNKQVEADDTLEDDLALIKDPALLRPDVDEELAETTGETPGSIPLEQGSRTQREIPAKEKPPEIDPNTFIDVKPKKLNTRLPDPVTSEEYMDDTEKAEKMDIVESFVDDDVIEEFMEIEKEEEERSKVNVPEAVPGWGSWGGTDIKPSERKNTRNLLSVPKPPPKRDYKNKDIIFREKANQKIVEHMVKDLPHPFLSVGAFEANIREPIGREWIPETAHRKFIKAPVETQMGVVIDPMDENELLRLARDRKSLYKGKKKTAKT